MLFVITLLFCYVYYYAIIMLIPTRLDKNSLYVTASVRFAGALSIFPRY